MRFLLSVVLTICAGAAMAQTPPPSWGVSTSPASPAKNPPPSGWTSSVGTAPSKGQSIPAPALSETMVTVDAEDLSVGTKKYVERPLLVRNVRCYYADVEDYRCISALVLPVAFFSKKVEPDEARQFIESRCDTLRKALLSAACAFNVRFSYKSDQVSQDIISGFKKRTVINPDLITVILRAR